MIKVQHLHKTIGQKEILSDISVEIKKGAITAIIGPNGAGKSTLLSAITRLSDYDRGAVLLNDAPVEEMKSDDIAMQLAVLKQSNHTNLKITVRDLVNFGRFPYSKGRLTKEDEAIISKYIDFLDLTDLEKKIMQLLMKQLNI